MGEGFTRGGRRWGDRKSEKEGRDAAWGPKQETADIYIYMREEEEEQGGMSGGMGEEDHSNATRRGWLMCR